MKDYKLTVESFTVSWALGLYKGSEKNDSFMSAAVRCDPPMDLDDLPAMQIRAARQVSAAVIMDAVSRQALSEDDARTRLKEIKENFDGLEKAIIAKKQGLV